MAPPQSSRATQAAVLTSHEVFAKPSGASKQQQKARNLPSAAAHEWQSSPFSNNGPALTLESVIGHTVTHPARSDVCQTTDRVAMTAGCIAVIFDPSSNAQTAFLSAGSGKPLCAVGWAPGGRFLAVAESGHKPQIHVWDTESQSIIASCEAHKIGTAVLRFYHPSSGSTVGAAWNVEGKNGEQSAGFLFASVGDEHDGTIVVRCFRRPSATSDRLSDLSAEILTVASNKLTARVHDLCFAPDASFVATAGHRHVKFWSTTSPSSKSTLVDAAMSTLNLTTNQCAKKTTRSSAASKCVLEGKSGSLGVHRNDTFTGVVTLKDAVMCISSTGLLCSFNLESRALDKWVDLKISKTEKLPALSLSVNRESGILACGCADGVLRLFRGLEYITTLPKPPAFGSTWSVPLKKDSKGTAAALHADVIAVHCHGSNHAQLVTAFFSDRSWSTFDFKSTKSPRCLRSFSSHSGPIFGVDCVPVESSNIAANTFVTCGADNTLRFWNISSNDVHGPHNAGGCSATIPIGSDFSHMKVASACGSKSRPGDVFAMFNEGCAASNNGLRCVRVSGDGKLVAAGDRSGNITAYVMSDGSCVLSTAAHDSDVVDVCFLIQENQPPIMASAGRDRLIHMFSADNNGTFSLNSTFDDHSSAVTGVCFTSSDDNTSTLVSSSSDRALLFRKFKFDAGAHIDVIRSTSQLASQRGSVLDLSTVPNSQNVICSGQDKTVSVFDSSYGKLVKSFKTAASAGDGSHLTIDPSGQFVAISGGSDRSMRIYHIASGEEVSTNERGQKQTSLRGLHAEAITGAVWLPDGNHIITVGSDACIFAWRVSYEIAAAISQKLHTAAVPFNAIQKSVDNFMPATTTVFESQQVGGSGCILRTSVATVDLLTLSSAIGEFGTDQALPSWAAIGAFGQKTGVNIPTKIEQPMLQSVWSSRTISGSELSFANVPGSPAVAVRQKIQPLSRTERNLSGADSPENLREEFEPERQEAGSFNTSADNISAAADDEEFRNPTSVFTGGEAALRLFAEPIAVGEGSDKRMSISKQFFERSSSGSPASTGLASIRCENAIETLPPATFNIDTDNIRERMRQRHSSLAKEVERTRARLALLGIVLPPRQGTALAHSRAAVAKPEDEPETRTEQRVIEETPAQEHTSNEALMASTLAPGESTQIELSMRTRHFDARNDFPDDESITLCARTDMSGSISKIDLSVNDRSDSGSFIDVTAHIGGSPTDDESGNHEANVDDGFAECDDDDDGSGEIEHFDEADMTGYLLDTEYDSDSSVEGSMTLETTLAILTSAAQDAMFAYRRATDSEREEVDADVALVRIRSLIDSVLKQAS